MELADNCPYPEGEACGSGVLSSNNPESCHGLTILYHRLKLSHLKGSREKQRQNLKKNLSCLWGIEPMNPGFSHQCSSH